MLVTITFDSPDPAARPATDLGFLLHKHPDRLHAATLGSWGRLTVAFPEASAERCTAALWVDLDPIAMVRDRSTSLRDHISDRPYAASSYLAVALTAAFRTALGGRSKDRPDLVDRPLPLTLELPGRPRPASCSAASTRRRVRPGSPTPPHWSTSSGGSQHAASTSIPPRP